MDAHDDEGDIKLQKESADLIADLDRALPKFLRKPDGHGGYRLRTRIRVVEKHRIDSAVRTLARPKSPATAPTNILRLLLSKDPGALSRTAAIT